MATNNIRPTAAADQPSASRSSLVLDGLNRNWPDWRGKGGCGILPPIYKWNNPAYGQSALEDRARKANELKRIPGRTNDYDRENMFRLKDEASRSEHVVYRVFHELINDEVFIDELSPMFGFSNLKLNNENCAFEIDVWNRVTDGRLLEKNSTLGELDFTILGSKLGMICVEVKSSPYPSDFIIGSKHPISSRLKDVFRKFDNSAKFLLNLLEEEYFRSIGIQIDRTSLPVRRVFLLTNVERARFDGWYASLDDERNKNTTKTWIDSFDFQMWFKDDSINEKLSTLLSAMAGDVEKLEPSRKESLKVIYEAFVPIMVGMKSLIVGQESPRGEKLHLVDEEQLSLLKAIEAEEENLDRTNWENPSATKQQSNGKGDTIGRTGSVRKQYFLTPPQQMILNGCGHRKLIFGPAGVGKTFVLWEKIRRQIVEERQNAKTEGRPQLPVMIMAPSCISGEYNKFLRVECEFEQEIDYLINDRYFFETYFMDPLKKVLPILFEFAKRTKNYRAMLASILLYFAEKPGRDGHIGEPDNAAILKDILDSMMDKRLVEKFWSRLGMTFKTIINNIDHNTLRNLIDADRLVVYLRSSGIFTMALDIFDTPNELIELLESLGVPNTILNYVPIVFAMKSLVDPLTIVEAFLKTAFQTFLDSNPALTQRLWQLDDDSTWPIFSTMMDDEHFDDVSDLEVLIRFFKDALNDEAIREQMIIVLPWLSKNNHVFIEDALDEDKTSLRYPLFSLVGVVLFMELLIRLSPSRNVWVALDPYKCRFVDYPNDDILADKIVVNLYRLQNSDESFSDDGNNKQRFELHTLRDVMRCSKQIFEHCYELGEKETANDRIAATGWRESLKPRPGHNYLGTTPTVGRAKTFPTFEDARDGLWSKLKETIVFLDAHGFAEAQFAMIIGDRAYEYDYESTLFDFLTSKCNDELVEKFHRSIHHWTKVSSLEWPVVIYANVLPKGIDLGEFGAYRKYRAMSRAKVHLIEFEYFYEEAIEKGQCKISSDG